MENQTPAQPKKGFPTVIVIVIVIVALCALLLCCLLIVPGILALLGPAVGNVFSGVISNMVTVTP
jgi:flagellar basal body-associated protein FliL